MDNSGKDDGVRGIYCIIYIIIINYLKINLEKMTNVIILFIILHVSDACNTHKLYIFIDCTKKSKITY